MAPPARVRESCIPCRQRKSRCNAEQPCSSCLLRGTEGECKLPSQGGPSGPSSTPRPAKKKRTDGPSRSVSPKLRAHRLSEASIKYSPPPPTEEEKRNWQQVLAVLPPRASCEILLEYLIQECDWLWHFGDIIGQFRIASETGGVTSTRAGLLCMYIAIPAIFLGDYPSSVYRPNISVNKVHKDLFAAAQAFRPTRPESLDDVDLLQAINVYLVYSGQPAYPSQVPVVELAASQGWLDESSDSWDDLNNEQRSERRRIGWGLISMCRWKLLMLKGDPLSGIRINLCRPNWSSTHLREPVHLDLHRPQDAADIAYRMLRIISPAEALRIARSREIMLDITEIIPRTEGFLRRIKEVDSDVLLGECETLYRDLLQWREELLPQAGFASLTIEQIDINDPISCRYASQALVMNMAVGHLCANILRHWLCTGDMIDSSPSPHKRLYAACLENARHMMSHIPSVKALVSSRNGPIITPFVASNLFNAATCFAVPVLRAVRYWTTMETDTEDDIRKLPTFPDHYYDTPESLSRNPHVKRLPTTIYSDSTVKECATNILVILDALSDFNANPLGQEAEKKLADMIHQYGLRDSQTVQPFDPWSIITSTSQPMNLAPQPPMMQQQQIFQPPLNQVNPVPINGHANFDAGWNFEPLPLVPQNTPPDFAFLSSLLQLDSSIWEGLMDVGTMPKMQGPNGES